MTNQMTGDSGFRDPSSMPGEVAAPDYLDGADLAVIAKPHDQGFWDRHPDVASYRVTVPTGVDHDEDQTVLVWLKAETPRHDTPGDFTAPEAAPLDRPADLVLSVHAAHGLGFFARHPDLVAWKVDVALGQLVGHGADHKLSLWLRREA